MQMQFTFPTEQSTKRCTKCGEFKPLSEFTQYKTGRQAGSYSSWCKRCAAVHAAAYRAAHPERPKQKQSPTKNAKYRERIANDPEFREKRNNKSRAWRERNRAHIATYNAERYANDPEYLRAASRASKEKYPERDQARYAVKTAVRQGILPPACAMVCERCQEAQAGDWHHPDYSKPLDVQALCTECHGKEHWV
jgi:hypothetical protein